MPYTLSSASEKALAGVHPDLQAIIIQTLKTSRVDFRVLEGRRTEKRQLELYRRGATKLLHSRHLNGFAVDLGVLDGKQISWHWPEYIILAAGVKQAAQDLKLPIIWGGDWAHFKDGGHYELPKHAYPDPA